MRRFVVVVAFLLVATVIGVGIYASMLNRRASAIVFTSPMISYRYSGTYEGFAQCLHVKARVRITMEGTGITAIELLQRPFGNMSAIVARIIAAGGVPVDAVTCATASSRVLMKAVDNALMDQHP